ncbi:MAG: aminopeptidase [Gammaproteobacteria bacterium]|nr:aminopeptidase [Gammaproteobacteria bacterium]
MTRLTNTVVAMLLLSPVVAFAGPDYDEIAANLVNQSLSVQPGEVIQISGTPDQMELISATYVAVAKAGGEPIVTLNLPEATKRAMMESDIKHLERTSTAPVLLTKIIDGFISVASVQDPDLFADVPEERLAAIRRAGTPVNHVFRNAKFRSVSLGQTGGIPTEGYAATIGADADDMRAMFWKALAVSPQQINDAAAIVNGMLSPGVDIHVESDLGTDLRFRIADNAPRVNAGRTTDVEVAVGPRQVWLPAGEAYAIVEPGSAQGTLVVRKAMFRGKPIENLKLRFDNGRLTDVDGKGASMLEDFFASSDEASSMLSVVDIGLNPHSQTPRGSDYMSWEMGGMVTLVIGNNAWAGGDNGGDGSFSVHVPGASVAAGGSRLTANGQLPSHVMAVYKR